MPGKRDKIIAHLNFSISMVFYEEIISKKYGDNWHHKVLSPPSKYSNQKLTWDSSLILPGPSLIPSSWISANAAHTPGVVRTPLSLLADTWP